MVEVPKAWAEELIKAYAHGDLSVPHIFYDGRYWADANELRSFKKGES